MFVNGSGLSLDGDFDHIAISSYTVAISFICFFFVFFCLVFFYISFSQLLWCIPSLALFKFIAWTSWDLKPSGGFFRFQIKNCKTDLDKVNRRSTSTPFSLDNIQLDSYEGDLETERSVFSFWAITLCLLLHFFLCCVFKGFFFPTFTD